MSNKAEEAVITFDRVESFSDLSPREIKEYIACLPKADLHCHLDGSLRLKTLIELAKKDKVELPSYEEEELRRIFRTAAGSGNLPNYIKLFDYPLAVMQDEDNLCRIAYELVEDTAKENIRYLEVRFSPILHTKKKLNLTRVMEAVLTGLRDGRKKYDTKNGVIICGIRQISPDSSIKLAELTVAYKYRGVVGFDLAGIEDQFPAKDHKEAFYLIRNNCINCTVHAGEAYGPDSIKQALHYLNAHRLGHGTRLKEDGDLLNYVNDHRIPLEISLTSNIQTGSVRDYGAHPAKFYYDCGVRVTLNTDNRLFSDTTLTDELYHAVEQGGFQLKDIKRLIVNGFKSAFLHYRQKVNLIDSALTELGLGGRLVYPQRNPFGSDI
ncbi:adenosine deaminase [bacterium]|nr:adenosine deaminase [bacterium]